jgi:hypothetical protein
VAACNLICLLSIIFKTRDSEIPHLHAFKGEKFQALENAVFFAWSWAIMFAGKTYALETKNQ